jgi:hypothetical protein
VTVCNTAALELIHYTYKLVVQMWILQQQKWRQHPLVSSAISYIRRSSVFFCSLYFSFILTGFLINIITSLDQFSVSSLVQIK